MEHSLAPHLLIGCLRSEFSDELPGQLAQLSLADWNRLIIWASKQQVETLVYARLQKHELASLIPAPIRKRLQSYYQAEINRNTRLKQPLGELLTELQHVNIPTIVCKDIYLAESLYVHFATRRIGEFDLLVAADHIPAAVETLLALGYRPFGALRSDKAKLLATPLPRFMKAGIPASVMLHQTLMPASALVNIVDMPAVWQRALPIKLAGTDVLRLACEDQLLCLAEQAIHRRLLARGLYAVCDLSLFIHHQQTTLNWDAVQERTHQWQWEKEVHLALYLAKALLDAPVPDRQLQMLQPADYTEELPEQAITQLFANGWPSREQPVRLPARGYQRLIEQGYRLLQLLRLARSTPSHV